MAVSFDSDSLFFDNFDYSLNSGNYTLLVPTFMLNAAAFTPVAGSTAAYLDLIVNAPIGTQSLLFDVGNANSAFCGARQGKSLAPFQPIGSSVISGPCSQAQAKWTRTN